MSVKALSAAFEAGVTFNLPPVSRLILLRLGDRADDYGYCWPGIDDLAVKAGVDGRTIQRHLATLERDGLILRLILGGGRTRSTLYRMLPNILSDSSEAPGLLRYLERFGAELNGDILSPLLRGTDVAGRQEKVTGDAGKRRHSYVTRSVMNQNETSDDISNSEPEPDPKFGRLPGESTADFRRRTRHLISN